MKKLFVLLLVIGILIPSISYAQGRYSYAQVMDALNSYVNTSGTTYTASVQLTEPMNAGGPFKFLNDGTNRVKKFGSNNMLMKAVLPNASSYLIKGYAKLTDSNFLLFGTTSTARTTVLVIPVTISGLNISYGNAVTVDSGLNNNQDGNFSPVVLDSTRVFLAYSWYNGTSTSIKGVVVSFSSGNLTYGSPVTIVSSCNGMTSEGAVLTSSNTIAIGFQRYNSTWWGMQVPTVSGNNINSIGTPYDVNMGSNTPNVSLISSGKCLLSSEGYNYGLIANVSGQGVSWASTTTSLTNPSWFSMNYIKPIYTGNNLQIAVFGCTNSGSNYTYFDVQVGTFTSDTTISWTSHYSNYFYMNSTDVLSVSSDLFPYKLRKLNLSAGILYLPFSSYIYCYNINNTTKQNYSFSGLFDSTNTWINTTNSNNNIILISGNGSISLIKRETDNSLEVVNKWHTMTPIVSNIYRYKYHDGILLNNGNSGETRTALLNVRAKATCEFNNLSAYKTYFSDINTGSLTTSLLTDSEEVGFTLNNTAEIYLK